MASYNYPSFGDKRWKTPVATVASLPITGSIAGDCRVTLDTFKFYIFNGTAWALSATGDVVGPASSTTNSLVQFGDTTGKLLKNLALGTANQVLGMTNAATNQEYKTLSVGTTGTDFAIAHAANSVAFNLPDASATARGVITTGVQTIAGVKTFSSTITGSISGNAATVTTNANLTGPITSTGNATSIAAQTGTGTTFAMSAGPTFTGTVTIPTPFTIGAVSMTATGTQLNYLNAATGTTGTTSTNLVFSASPTFTGTPVLPTPFTIGAISMTATGTQLNYLNAATGTTGTTSTNVVFSTSPSITTPTFVTNITTPQINAAGAMILATNGSTTALTLSTAQLATFTGNILSTIATGSSVIGSATAYNTTSPNAGNAAPKFQVDYASSLIGVSSLCWDATLGQGMIVLGTARGGIGTYTAVQNGDVIGAVEFAGANDAAMVTGAYIASSALSTWKSTATVNRQCNMKFYTTPASSATATLALTLGSDQSATFGGIVDTGSTGQIKFPATQNASSDANTLDDYEEGTWTPTWRGSSGSAGTASATGANGIYSKVGNMVFVTGYLPTTNLGSWSGVLILGGLPFTPRVSFYTGLMVEIWSGLGTNKIMQPMYINSNSTDFNPTAIAAATTFNTELTVADITTSFYVRFSGTFLV